MAQIKSRQKPQITKTKAKLPDPKKGAQYFENRFTFITGPYELKEMLGLDEPPVVVDVREPEDYAEGHVPGAINLPASEWLSLKGLTKGKLNVVYCYSIGCQLSHKASAFFSQRGFPVKQMEGGFELWKESELPVEKGKVARERAKKAA